MDTTLKPAERLKKEQAKAQREKLELDLLQQIRAVGLPGPAVQHRFCVSRRWRFDLSWGCPDMLAVEVDGGTWSGGRHTRGAGYAADCEKCAEAVLGGWRVIRVTGDHIKSGQALGWIERALASKSAQ